MGWQINDYEVQESYSPRRLNDTLGADATQSLMYRGQDVWSPSQDYYRMETSPVKLNNTAVPRMRFRGVDILHKHRKIYGTSCDNGLLGDLFNIYQSALDKAAQRKYGVTAASIGTTEYMNMWYTARNILSACANNTAHYWTLGFRSVNTYSTETGFGCGCRVTAYRIKPTAYLQGDGEDFDIGPFRVYGSDLEDWLSSCKSLDVNDYLWYIIINCSGEASGNGFYTSSSGSRNCALAILIDAWGSSDDWSRIIEVLRNYIRNCHNNRTLITRSGVQAALQAMGQIWLPDLICLTYGKTYQGIGYYASGSVQGNNSYRNPINYDNADYTLTRGNLVVPSSWENTRPASDISKGESTYTGFWRGSSWEGLFNWGYYIPRSGSPTEGPAWSSCGFYAGRLDAWETSWDVDDDIDLTEDNYIHDGIGNWQAASACYWLNSFDIEIRNRIMYCWVPYSQIRIDNWNRLLY